MSLEALDAWNSGHKSRCVRIHIDDGYGATCWVVELWGRSKRLIVTEVHFLSNAVEGRCPCEKEVYQHAVITDEDSDEDWPGLAKTVDFALAKAEQYRL